MMGWYQNGWGWGWMGSFGMLVMFAVWAGLIVLAVWSISRFTRTDHHTVTAPESARAVLDRRFAAGDIDAEAYAQARRVLEGRSSEPPAVVGQ